MRCSHSLLVQVVVTAAGASEAPAGRMDAAALDRIAIRVSPRVFGNRIRCVREEADVAKEVCIRADQCLESWRQHDVPSNSLEW